MPQLKAIFWENTPQYFAPEEWSDLESYLEKNASTYFCLMDRATLIGAGGYRLINSQSAQFHWNFLASNYQRQGLGSKLLSFCIEEIAKQSEVKSLEVWTSQHAEAFYHKFGFKELRREENYWAPGLHLVQMKYSF